MRQRVLVTGATGYLGSRLCARLAARGHEVRGLARAASAHRLPAGVEPCIGDALDPVSVAQFVPLGGTVAT